MSFRYINPGYAELLTFRNADTETVKNETYNKINGVSFTTSGDYNYFTLPENNIEFYCLFNMFFPNKVSYNGLYYGVAVGSNYYSNRTGLIFYTLSASTSDLSIKMAYDNSVISVATIPNYNTAGIQNFWLHVRRKTTESINTGLIELSIDRGKTIISKEFDSSITLYQNLNFSLRTNFISNIIISDEYISPKEQIISLPISATESDMTFDSETGIYTATATNQSLLSAVNVNSLSAEYGSDSTVTGIALVGNPAYKTAEGLSSLTAFSKDNSANVVEYGTYALGSDSSGIISGSQIFSDTKIADLQNLKFGWIAK